MSFDLEVKRESLILPRYSIAGGQQFHLLGSGRITRRKRTAVDLWTVLRVKEVSMVGSSQIQAPSDIRDVNPQSPAFGRPCGIPDD